MTTHRIGIIGLGVMGQRMLGAMLQDNRFDVIVAMDADASLMQSLQGEYPDIQMIADAKDLLARIDIDSVYIATPPRTHVNYANLAIDFNKSILCEKPLSVNLNESRQLVERIQEKAVRNAVNFSLSSREQLEIIENAIQSGSVGEQVGIEICCRFSQWPRVWQQGAGRWLSERVEGGFVREVLSHLIHMTERVIGKVEVLSSEVEYPDEQSSENHIMASMLANKTPFKLMGGVGGHTPDRVDWVLYGTKKSFRYVMSRAVLQESTDDGWVDIEMKEKQPVQKHLTAISNMLNGEPHPLPDFAMGLRVQETVESLLASK